MNTNIALWLCQTALALVYASSGLAKGTLSKQRMLETGQTGVRAYSLPFIRFIAACELLGAIGLMLPGITSIATVLTPLAAAGLGVIMVGAARAHFKQHELRNVATNVVLLALCLAVAIGRFGWVSNG